MYKLSDVNLEKILLHEAFPLVDFLMMFLRVVNTACLKYILIFIIKFKMAHNYIGTSLLNYNNVYIHIYKCICGCVLRYQVRILYKNTIHYNCSLLNYLLQHVQFTIYYISINVETIIYFFQSTYMYKYIKCLLFIILMIVLIFDFGLKENRFIIFISLIKIIIEI